MTERKCCGPLCQHPGCWISGKIEMIEAFKRFTLVESSRLCKSIRASEDRKLVESIEEPLPTLKIVNVFESEEELGFDNSQGDLAFIIPTKLPYGATRSSKNPRSNCVTPFPSLASHQFFKTENITMHTESKISEKEINSKIQTACITIQEAENERVDLGETNRPYLVWIPSKKSKKKRKHAKLAGSLTRQMDLPRIHTKNITGNNFEFGFLKTPFNKEVPITCYSRATHTVKSPPSRLHPRRLPPMSREVTEKSIQSKDFRVSGDGVFTSMRITPTPGLVTPQNTQASIFTGGIPEEWDPECSKELDEISEKGLGLSLPVVDSGTIFEHYASNDRKDISKLAGESKALKETREEITLPKVSLPKTKLKELAIENHCRNSIPSHQLFDIQMQPIYGAESTMSDRSVIDKDVKVGKIDLALEHRNRTVGTKEEALASNENDVNNYEGDGDDSDVVSREEVISAWEFEPPKAPVPTPVSPRKKITADVYGDLDVIEFIRQEQERTSVAESRSVNRMAGDDVRGSMIASVIVSPVPSRSNSDEWSSDKDIMRQTYERYRSFTPFKTSQINLGEVKLASIQEASREHTLMTTREKSLATPPTQTTSMSRYLARPTPHYFRVEAEAMRNTRNYPKRMNQFASSMKSVSWRRPQVKNISEINVSTITPRQRIVKSKATQRLGKKQFSCHVLPLEGTALSSYHKHISANAIYEALVNSQSVPHCNIGLNQSFVPAPNQDAFETKESPDITSCAPKTFSEASGIDTNHIDIKEIRGNVANTSEESKTSAVVINNTTNGTETGVCDVVKVEKDCNQLSIRQTTGTCDIDISYGLGSNGPSRSSRVGENASGINVITKDQNEVDDGSHHEEESQRHLFPNGSNRTGATDESDQNLHIESYSYLAQASPMHSLRVTSTADGDSDAESNLNVESGLDFLSFSSELDLSLDLDSIKKEVNDY